MRVLLLGVGGFIGSHLVDRLLRNPDSVVEGLDLTDEKLEQVRLLPKFTFVRGDIRHEHETCGKTLAAVAPEWRPTYGLDETIERSMAGFVPYASTPAP